MEITMTCRADVFEGPVLVSRNPTMAVFTTTQEHLDSIKKKSDGHYDRNDLMTLAKEGRAVHYDEKAVRAIAAAMQTIIFGCPPW
jgi:hypothetical protein